MVSALLIAGILSVLAGLLAIVYGVSVQAFSLGNTMIVVGATAACTGMLLIGLWVVVGELKTIARRLALAPRTAAVDSRERLSLPPPGASPRSAEGGFLSRRDEAAMQEADELETAAPPVSPQPWQDDTAPRDRPRLPPLPEPALESAPSRPGRDRLFSTSRKERDRTPPRAAEPFGSEGGRDAGREEVTEAASASFENAWPKPERARASEPALPRRSGRASRFTDAASEDRSSASIIKSGVVDGMAYSLFSDGSIEAQMPEGMMRFGTIEELRAHLDKH
jgi:hypothetical protein